MTDYVLLCYDSNMAHVTVEEAEKILDKEYKVLDYGFVRLVDYLGDDSRIVSSARVSYSGTKQLRGDSTLIDYLLRNDHTSPFEQVVFTFHLKMPIFVARQWVRHRTGRMNEISGRYSVMKEEFYTPCREEFCVQSKDNRQGRGEVISDDEYVKATALFDKAYKDAYESYTNLLNIGVAKEIARSVLPLGLYTEFYWQMDLHNLLHFLALRMDKHAQLEIRHYAMTIYEIVKLICPITIKAFEKHKLNSVNFTKDEVDVIKARLSGENVEINERDERILSDKLK